MSITTAAELWRMSATQLAEAIRSRTGFQSGRHRARPREHREDLEPGEEGSRRCRAA